MREIETKEDGYFIKNRDLCELFNSQFDLNVNLSRKKPQTTIFQRSTRH